MVGLSPETTELSIKKFVGKIGKVDEVKLIKDRVTGKLK